MVHSAKNNKTVRVIDHPRPSFRLSYNPKSRSLDASRTR